MRSSSRISTLLVGAAVAGLAIAGCGRSEPPSPPPAPKPPAPAPPAPAPGNQPHAGPQDQPAPGGTVSREQAGTIVTDTYGGQVINVEPDQARGEPSWEVEVRNSEQGRIEVDVAQRNGAIVEMERD